MPVTGISMKGWSLTLLILLIRIGSTASAVAVWSREVFDKGLLAVDGESGSVGQVGTI